MKVALYVRVSTAEQAKEGYSIGEQQERLQKYCEAHKWDIYKTYTDPGFSGAKMDRPALQELIQDAKLKHFDKVIVYKLDRLSRSQKDTLMIIEDILLANKVDFVSMSENFDTSTPFGKAMIGILAVFAQLEREQIKERLVMGREARAKKGLWHGGREAPYGYEYIDGQLVVNEFEAMVVRKIFDMAHQGIPYHEIARLLNEEGYQTRTVDWERSTVRKVISRETYAGIIMFGEDQYEGLHEAIITPELFHEVQDIKKRRTKDWNDKQYNSWKASSCISGLVYCARCGRKYYIRTNRSVKNGGKYRYIYKKFVCDGKDNTSGNKPEVRCDNKTWRKEKLIDLVLGEIRKLALEPDSLDRISEKPEKKDDKKIIKSEIRKIDTQISKLMDLYSLESMSFDVVKGKIDTLCTKKKALEDKIIDLDADKEKKSRIKDLKKRIRDIPKILDSGTEEEIREIVVDLIDKIEIDGDDVAIYWNF